MNGAAYQNGGYTYDGEDDEDAYLDGDELDDDQQQQSRLRNSAASDQQLTGNGDENDGASGSGEGSSSSLTRHGFDASEETLQELASKYFLYFNDTRHQNAGRAKPLPYTSPPDWRAKDKVKIIHGVLVVCLRIGYDPPDVIKTNPCARFEGWVDTLNIGKDRAMEQISANLIKQFDSLAQSSKAKFQTHMDPPHEDLRKMCVGLRRKARNDRALFHYNGHGVPRPTASGEIWVFNRAYTQYIPVSIADIVGYLQGPTIYLWDCSNAGNIVNKIVELQHLPEGKYPVPTATTAASSGSNNASSGGPTPPEPANPVQISNIQDILQIAACGPHETLPMNPDLPADLFTCCVTSPIEMSVRFFLLHNPLRGAELGLDMGMKIPGKLSDRKTPIGELVWIFTSVTDTIAWNTVPRHIFQRLFRHDLVLAAIFRGFLLAERIMRRYGCTPMSVPALPSCANHPLWDSWDLALDRALSQMPAHFAYEAAKAKAEAAGEAPPAPVTYSHSYFFADHLSAFSVWIDQGTARTVEAANAFLDKGQILTNGYKRTLPPGFAKAVHQTRSIANGDGQNHSHAHDGQVTTRASKNSVPVYVGQLKRYHKTLRMMAEQPEHLPILLQVLLSQVHRLRALMLLCKFLDLGPWAVNLGLSIGIFPYVLKLLQAPGPELRPVLVYIWARILAIYRLCQEDLAKAAGPPSARNGGRPELPFHYFAAILDPHQQMLVIPNVSEHRAMCAFILCVFMRDYPYGQQLALTSLPPNSRSNVFESCLYHLNDEDPLLRQWSAICIGFLWDDFDEAKGLGVRLKAHSELTTQMHSDAVPEVRAAILFALGVFIGTSAGDLLNGKSNAGRSLSGSAVDRTGLSELWQADEELGVVMATLKMQSDASPLVRKELVILLSAVVYNYRGSFVVAAYDHALEAKEGIHKTSAETFEERMRIMEQSLKNMDTDKSNSSTYSPGFRAIMFSCMYRVLLDLAADPFPDVSSRAEIVIDYIHEQLLASDLPFAVPSSDDGSAHSADSDLSDDTHTSAHRRRKGKQPVASPVERCKPSVKQSLKALAQLGLSDVHVARHKDAARAAGLLGSSRSNNSSLNIPSSKSVAHFGDQAQVARALRPISSADDLVVVGSSNASFGTDSPRSSVRHPHGAQITVEEAREALFAQDAERLRKSRQTPAPVVVSPARTAAPVQLPANPAHEPPPPPAYRPGPVASDDQGRPNSHEMPLRSELFEWSAEYFMNPQMKEKESDEPGSVEYLQRHWRRERNEKVIIRTQPLKDTAALSRWDQLDVELDNSATPSLIAFHQFDPHLVAADAQGVLRVYDGEQRRCINRFHNTQFVDEKNIPPSKVTTMKFLNDDDAALLLTGTADGCIRIHRDYDLPKPHVVSAWRALSQLLPSTLEGSGLIAEWQQGRGRVLAAGNAKEIKIWDVSTEICTRELATRANSCVTSLTSDQVAGDIVVAGFGDGGLKVFDTRLPARETIVRVWRGFHRSWVQNVHMQRGGNRELLSAGLTGEVCLWDIRAEQPIRTFQAHQGGLTQLAVHEHAPVFATGSEAGTVKVWNMVDETPISRFRNTNFPRGTFARDVPVHPVSSMLFHPHDMLLGVGGTDAKLNVSHNRWSG